LLEINEKGLTLIEMLFSIVIILTLSTAFYQLIISFNHHYEIQDAVAAMQQEGRVSADLLVREIRNAGYDPKGVFDPTKNKKTKDRKVYRADLDPPVCETKKHLVERVLEATSTSVQFLADLNGDNSVDDPREHIRYEWVGSAPSIDLCGDHRTPYTLYRESGSGMQEVATNISSFNLSYYDENDALLFFDIDEDGEADPLLKEQRERIRRIVIDLTARAGKKDPEYLDNNGYRMRSYSSDIRFKNL